VTKAAAATPKDEYLISKVPGWVKAVLIEY
jgi:hypothetical protein